MKRWTLKLALCLFAGAVVTWGVAWGCALAPTEIFPSSMLAYSGSEALELAPTYGLTPRPPQEMDFSVILNVGKNTGLGVSTQRAEITQASGSVHLMSMHQMFIRQIWTGWPAHALHGTMTVKGMSMVWTMSGLWEPPPRVQAFIHRRRPLPIRVLPFGFALNTLLAAGVLLGLVEGVAFARRRVRRAKGRCPSCGYDRGGLAKDAACPECGAKV
jgi:hypothetical protein